MKKIYTITFHNANNYGAMIQAYALQHFLLEYGYDSKIIDYDNLQISDQYRIFKKDKKNILKFIKHIFPMIYKLNSELIRQNSYNKFRKSLRKFNFEREADIDADAIICGSDQIWNPSITNGLDDMYFLNFGKKDIKRIAYAASCGNSSKINNVEDFVEKIKNIDYISVREKELQDFLSKNGINSEVVIDPSLLLEKSQWQELITSKPIEKQKYIFTYCVGNGTKKYYDCINEIGKKYNLKVVFFDKWCKEIKCKRKNYYSAGPMEFLNLMLNSEFVITTSFHGFALSTILNKKMLVFPSTYPDRLITLAKKLDLLDLFVDEESNYETVLNKKIDWNKVNKLLSKERKQSVDWLIKSIEDRNGKEYE